MNTRRVLVAVIVWTGVGSATAQTAPDGFEVSLLASGFVEPVALAATCRGQVFVAERGGTVWIIDQGQRLGQPFAELEVHAFNEAGLLGLALDPQYATTGHVYAFATVSAEEQRIVRWTQRNGRGEDFRVIRSNLPTEGNMHNGGCLRFGPDGMLYFSIGDLGYPPRSQELNNLAGTLCRIQTDGSTPAGNPFTTPTGAPRAIIAYGFRNPFRFCLASDGRAVVMDVGSDAEFRREEINFVERGANYGWPDTEGMFDAATFPDYTTPAAVYSLPGSAITGCTFYEAQQFPAAYRGNLFHLDFAGNALFRAEVSGHTVTNHEAFMTVTGGPVDLAVGPGGSLLWAEHFSGEIKELRYTAATDPDPCPEIDVPVNGDDTVQDDSVDTAGDDVDQFADTPDTAPDDNADATPDTEAAGRSGGCGAGGMAMALCAVSLTGSRRFRRRMH